MPESSDGEFESEEEAEMVDKAASKEGKKFMIKP